MAVYRTKCPHCHTSNVAFDSVQEWAARNPEDRRGLFICGNCREGIIVAFLPGLQALSQADNVESANIYITRVWPEPLSTDAPDGTPERAAVFFKQASESLSSAHYDAAGLMFRKSLESATKSLGQSVQQPLIRRIDALADAHLITPDMKVWAHQVRLGGNEAAHEDDPFSPDDAHRLSSFTDAFLKYAFTFPALVAQGVEPSVE